MGAMSGFDGANSKRLQGSETLGIKQLLALGMLLLVSLLSPTAGAEDDVFSEANRLKQAILGKDLDYIRALDPSGTLLLPENLDYLFDEASAKSVHAESHSVQQILRTVTTLPLISRYELNGRLVYTIYWVADDAEGKAVLGWEHWMKTVAACAIERAADGKWMFAGNLCFAETGGPFE